MQRCRQVPRSAWTRLDEEVPRPIVKPPAIGQRPGPTFGQGRRGIRWDGRVVQVDIVRIRTTGEQPGRAHFRRAPAALVRHHRPRVRDRRIEDFRRRPVVFHVHPEVGALHRRGGANRALHVLQQRRRRGLPRRLAPNHTETHSPTPPVIPCRDSRPDSGMNARPSAFLRYALESAPAAGPPSGRNIKGHTRPASRSARARLTPRNRRLTAPRREPVRAPGRRSGTGSRKAQKRGRRPDVPPSPAPPGPPGFGSESHT